MSNSSIWPIDRTLSGATTPGQSRPGSNGNEEVLFIPQSSSITRDSPSDCLMSHPGYSLGKSYLSAKIPTGLVLDSITWKSARATVNTNQTKYIY